MQIKKTLGALTVCALFLTPLDSQAATCRAGSAAETGSQTGYNKAKKAADAWYERESDVSSSLQQCLDRIRTLSITMPNFSSLSDILNGYAEEICNSAVNEVNSHIPSNIDPWDELTN
ncbi:hypothetical protein [Serratia ficaria]|uniref:hypothetical protein n=1 Tax=Serratia ficaria TaxID=61651 RepID=UPI00077CA71D|nr:hypothetical protein [Serratia ficaria]